MNALIVEDSRLARKELQLMLDSLGRFAKIWQAENAEKAEEIIQNEKIDILFLDIQLPGKNGFDLLASLDKSPAVIFTTAFDEYAIKSFEYNTLDYLMKPIALDRLVRAIDKINIPKTVGVKKRNKDQQIFVRDGDKCWFVKIEDIRLLESMGNYTRIYFHGEKPMILKSLSQLEDILDHELFFRANRQQIVNVKYIDDIQNSLQNKLKIKLNTGEVIEVSRRQSSSFRDQFGL